MVMINVLSGIPLALFLCLMVDEGWSKTERFEDILLLSAAVCEGEEVGSAVFGKGESFLVDADQPSNTYLSRT